MNTIDDIAILNQAYDGVWQILEEQQKKYERMFDALFYPVCVYMRLLNVVSYLLFDRRRVVFSKAVEYVFN